MLEFTLLDHGGLEHVKGPLRFHYFIVLSLSTRYESGPDPEMDVETRLVSAQPSHVLVIGLGTTLGTRCHLAH